MPQLHRIVPLIAFVTGIFLLSSCLGGAPGPATPASQHAVSTAALFRGNLQRTGVYDRGGKPLFTNSERLWKYRAEYSIDTPPVVGEGLAFIQVLNYGLHAIDLQTGALQYNLDGYGTPTIADGVLYYAGHDGLHAMDLKTRHDRWMFPTPGGISPAAIYNGVVYFGSGTDTSNQTAGAGVLYAVDVQTGQEQWHFSADDMISSAPTIEDGLIYIVSDQAHQQADVVMDQRTLRALDLATGHEVWHFAPSGSAFTPGSVNDPTVYEGLVYCASSFWADVGPGYIYALDAKTGHEVWKHTTADQLWDPEPAAADNGLLYVAASVPRWAPGQSGEAPIYALDAKTGQEKWTFRGGAYLTGPSLSDGVLYAAGGAQGGERGLLFAIDAVSGKQLQKYELENGLSMPPTLADGTLYVIGHSFEELGDVLLAIK